MVCLSGKILRTLQLSFQNTVTYRRRNTCLIVDPQSLLPKFNPVFKRVIKRNFTSGDECR